MRARIGCVLLLMAAACVSDRLEAVGVSYSPPRPFAMRGYRSGSPPWAMFGKGLELARFTVAAPAATDDAAAYAAALVAQGALEPGDRGSRVHTGSLPAGPCVKLELDPAARQGMVYVLPRARGYVILKYVDAASDYAINALHIEQSLAKLRADP